MLQASLLIITNYERKIINISFIKIFIITDNMPTKVGSYSGYDIFVSDRFPKKYYAQQNNGRKIYFGDVRYGHFKDKMGYYFVLDHGDKEKRRLYRLRHHKTSLIKYSPSWFAKHLLW